MSEHDQLLLTAQRLVDQRDYPPACNILEQAMARAQQGKNGEWEATLGGVLGWVYVRSGQYLQAEKALQRSIYLWTQLQGPDSFGLVPALGNLGSLYYEAGQYSRAEKSISRALDIALASNEEPGVIAMLQTNLGDIYFVEHKDALAEQIAEEAAKRFAILNDADDGSARDSSLLAAIYLRTGRFDQSESSFKRALSIWQTIHGPEDRRTAEGIGNLAVFYAASGQDDKAQPLFARAMEVFQKVGGDNAFMQNFLSEYVAAERKVGHKKDAKRLAKQLDQLVMASAGKTISRHVVDVSAFRSTK